MGIRSKTTAVFGILSKRPPKQKTVVFGFKAGTEISDIGF